MADCPNCHEPLPDDLVIKAGMSALGKRGRGKAKARPTHQCQKAAKTGWAKRTAKNSTPPGETTPSTQDPTA